MNLSFDVVFLSLTTVDMVTTGVPLLLLLFFHVEKERKSDVHINYTSIS